MAPNPFDRRRAWVPLLGALLLVAGACRRSSGSPSPLASTATPGDADRPLFDRPIRLPPLPSSPPTPGPVSVPKPIPNPLVSRGKPVFAHALAKYSKAEALVDGQFKTYSGSWPAGTPTAKEPAWAAIKVGKGFKKLLLVWSEGGSYNFNETTYGAPADYRIDVSADSTDGEDGSWKTVASVTANKFHARENAFDFDGQSWVKMVLLKAPENSPNGLSLQEIELFDLSGGGTDSWFFMGDSITAGSFDRESTKHQPSYAELVHAEHPKFFPAMICGGIGGENSKNGLDHLDEWLAVAPDFKYWAIGYGTNDAAGNTSDSGPFERNMSTIAERVLAAGRIPIFARIPFAADDQHQHLPAFNEALERVIKKHGLAQGPDLYTWFQKHPEQLADKLHPGEVQADAKADKNASPPNGIVEVNRLWWEATRWLYLP